MIGDAGQRLQGIVSWRVALRAYDVLEVISFTYMTHYASCSVFSCCIKDILLFPLPVHWVCFSRSLLVFSPLVLLSLACIYLAAGATVVQSTDTELHMPSSSVLNLLGVPSIMRSGQILTESILLHESAFMCFAADLVSNGQSRYTYCPISIISGPLLISLLWLPLKLRFSVFISLYGVLPHFR